MTDLTTTDPQVEPKKRGRPRKVVQSTMEKARGKESYYCKGGAGRSTGFLETLLESPAHRIILKDKVFPGGVRYGILIAPATLHTNERESGLGTAIWVGEIRRNNDGKICPKGRKGFWPHVKVPYDVAYQCGEEILGCMRHEATREMAEKVGEGVSTLVAAAEAPKPEPVVVREEDEIDRMMRELRK